MKLYLIEYFDKALDRSEYATIFGFSESDAREQFRYRIGTDKIIVSVEVL